MKRFQPIICAATLVLAVSVPVLAKPGTISTTRTGTISTTKTGTISTTAVGTISTTRTGTISTTRTGLIPTTRTTSLDQFSLLELLMTVFQPW